ncbi:alpha/beta fold hydrolase [Candidatus Poribacteria bacterium]|nr:alpha/beta fold hydrolase [Candidatus Poribacteria bacterium]
MSNKFLILAVIVLAVAVASAYNFAGKPATGSTRFFKSEEFHFQTLRAFSHIPSGGADTGEILATIGKIRDGNAEDWFREWDRAAKRVEDASRELKDPISRGSALLRAHSYYRTAEFLTLPGDPRKNESFHKSVETFHAALGALDVKYELLTIPYGDQTLKAVYYPGPTGAGAKPLIVVCGGYDSTMEETYFQIAAAAIERGYSCLTYEGPGQGSIIREQGIPFTPEWEKPNAAVLDEFLRRYPKPPKIVLIGISLGGYFAPRAAAFDNRIDGVVAFDVLFDHYEVVFANVPRLFTYLYEKGFIRTVDALAALQMRLSPEMKAEFQTILWKMGAKDAPDLALTLQKYNLRDVADKITCDVLILAGENDSMVPLEQVDRFKEKLVNARSVTTRVFTREEGGAEHCQLGASTLVHATLFDWLEKTFGPPI